MAELGVPPGVVEGVPELAMDDRTGSLVAVVIKELSVAELGSGNSVEEIGPSPGVVEGSS